MSSYIGVYANTSIVVNTTTSAEKTSVTPYTAARVKSLLLDPIKNHAMLKEASAWLLEYSSLYGNMLSYYSTLLTYDYIVVPTSKLIGSKTKLKKGYYAAAERVKKMSIQRKIPLLIFKTLQQGETFWYDVSDDATVIFKEVNYRHCKMFAVDDDNIWRYVVDLATVNDAQAKEMPLEVQDAYEKYKKSGGGGTAEVNNTEFGVSLKPNLYVVSKAGFALSCSTVLTDTHEPPAFSNMFIDLIMYEDDKETYNTYLKDSYAKLVHMKVPIDPKDGKPTMTADEVNLYFSKVKQGIPRNVKALATPFETDDIATDKAQTQGIALTDTSRKNAQYGSGIADSLWSPTTANALMVTIESNAARIKPLCSFIDAYVTFKLKSLNATFSIDTQITQYNKEAIYKARTTGLASGESYTSWLASSSLELYDALMIAEAEDALDLATLFAPKQSAYQTPSQSPGAPVKDTVSDSREVGSGYE